MALISSSRRSNPAFIRQSIVIIRNPDVGRIECDTCGGPALTQRELADAIGVSLSSLSSFMHRRSVRQDIDNRIRAAVKAVHE